MKLSVIIVNYNVRAYLEQCLRTVFEAMEQVSGDVYVVDNQSTDGSVEMVREKFPKVKLIANTENVGFSRANNQAIKASEAEYVVLLNPDTVVGEDVFQKVIAFMDAHPRAGGLGVKMIDGTGRFLPESKRGLPTPAVAFFKIIGLTRLFPKSRIFGRYHLGHLPEYGTAQIEILSGACMFLRKRTLDKVGLLDENFFMYGEDIDLSYRILLGGYENWYFPEARIIHYKGESTKKSSVNYVFVFYNAMAIFAQKHFTQRRTDVFSMLINGSIYLSAAGAIVSRFLRRALLPVLDLGVWFLVMTGLGLSPSELWVHGGVMFAAMALAGAYDLPVRLANAFHGALFGGLIYAAWMMITLPGSWANAALQYAGLLTGAMIAVSLGLRLILHGADVRPYTLRTLDRKRVLSIGSDAENAHALALLWQTHFGLGRQERMAVEEVTGPEAAATIRTRIRKQGIDEVVFCARDLRWAKIIALMERLRHTRALFKIAQPGREFIIGPNSIESLNDLFIMDQNGIQSSASRRRKRIMDISICVLLLLSLPVTAFLVQDVRGLLRNIGRVLQGTRTWVGYQPGMGPGISLPRLPQGVISPLTGSAIGTVPKAVLRANITYAKDYRPWDDLRWVINGLPSLGRD